MAHFGIQQQSHFRRNNRPSGVLAVPDVAVLAGAGGGDNNDDGNEASQDDGVFPAVLHDYPALFNGPLTENTSNSSIKDTSENSSPISVKLTLKSNLLFSFIFVENPPNLAEWRQKLFDLDETVFLSQQEYDMYFPWIDKVYSHQSTQRYKRKSFVSHYFDCRMKGRAPGTPKSDDPNKKKRKRNIRECNLCDVKIKISEYQTETSSAMAGLQTADVAGVDSEALAKAFSRFKDQSFWSIQRVNGNGTNGVGDGKPSKHRHTLGKSDEIKKCSVQRWLAARQKHATKNQRPTQWKPTGNAAATARKHTKDGKDDEIKFYAACFCPFSQRVWITLEAKGLEYQYCETDPLRRPAHLLEEDPVGLVPTVVKGAPSPKPPALRPCDESSIILEYLEEIDSTVLLHPTDARLKANCRLWIDFDIMTLVHAADEKGLDPVKPRLTMAGWIDAIEDNPHVRNTVSTGNVYTGTVDLVSRGFSFRVD
ncbi:hypothetical protein B0T26DRAFT_745414 [Lasiosphaeria miniovina]|uniref:GST N-terminal domain-containing protein n=1 Tax=Lasiosphaeria miniovina TaxID=1954250 RepID=A0AA40ECL5_9PEZI|nr:uncharacterized protein B0T26DRAFT_745414 [Lasiosphaeria miniovina]KAK0733372.1 hypothetical protein B0T26DRAFT_745414 [Lasiosphaeria miniovina]